MIKMDTFNVMDEENIGSNIFHMKKVSEKSVLQGVPDVRKKSFKTDNAGNKLRKPVRSALMDLANIKNVEASDLKPKLSSEKSPQLLKVSKSVSVVAESEEEWSDIEEMHIYEEPEDDYEDILPQHERVSILDIENLWFPKSGFSQLPPSPEQHPSASLDSFWTLSQPKISDDLPSLDCDFFGEGEIKLVPLRLDFSDSEDL